VKAWLDHSDIGVTQRYAHLAPDAIRGKVVDPSKSLGDNAGATETSHRPTNWSHLRDLNSRPTVYEKVELVNSVVRAGWRGDLGARRG
jgi:hypothetical protein